MKGIAEIVTEIIHRASAGPYPAVCVVLDIGQDGAAGIDVRETGQKIKKACLEHGYTVRRLREELDIGFQSVYAWFAGSTVPSLDNMYRLSSLFEIPMEQMIAGTQKHVSFWLKLEKTDADRTAKLVWKYCARELRSCIYENVRPDFCQTKNLTHSS